MTIDTGHGTARPKRESQRGSSPQPVDVAQALIDAVHRRDQVAVQRILRRPDLPRIAVILAEQIPAAPKQLMPCGTRGAAERHIARGELLDDACAEARRAYYRERSRRVRARPTTEFPRSTSTPSSTTSSVDPVVVERLTNGLHVPGARIAERAEAVRVLDSRGTTVTEISRRLHMSGSRVAQILAASVVAAADTHANNDRQEASA